MTAKPRSWRVIATVAIVGVLAIATVVVISTRRAEMNDVVAASAKLRHRPSPARLSGQFPFLEPKSESRGADARLSGDAVASVPLLTIAGELEQQVARTRTVPQLHALGVTYLLLEKPAAAVQILEDAVRRESGWQGQVIDAIRRSHSAALLNDLAAAYLSGPDEMTQPLALEAAQRSWTLARTPYAGWTRAVIIEKHHVREASITAWQNFLSVESSSPWSDDARKRLAAISQPTDAQRWPSIRDHLAAGAMAESEIFAVVDQSRQDVRLWCEDELLPQWAEGVRKGQPSDDLLARIEVLGRALEYERGEREVSGAVAAIRRATPDRLRQLAIGHAAFGAARLGERNWDAAGAVRESAAAVAALTPERTPFAARARIEHGSALYLANRYDAALEVLSPLLADERSLSDPGQGKVHALLGIIALQKGSYEKAAQHYARAVSAFRRAGERDLEATLVSRLAAALELAGELQQAQVYRTRALEQLDRTGDPKHRHDAMIEAAYVAIGRDHQAVADLYLDTLVANNMAARNHVTACTALMWRSAFKYRRGLLTPAGADLGAARDVCRSIADTAVRERALSNLALARVSVERDPSGDLLADLESAIAYYRRTNSSVWLRAAYFARGRALEQRDPAAAEQHFRAALDETDATRGKIDDRQVRISFTATTDEIVDGYVDFLLRQHRERDAFELADRSRSRELVDSPTARWRQEESGAVLREVQALLPRNTALIEYRVIRDRIIAWVVSADSFSTVSLSVSVADIRALLAAIDPDVPWEPIATRLYDALIRTLELDKKVALAIVADDELERVPFSALYDRAQRRYVLEDRSTVLSPSASLFVQSAHRMRERAAPNDQVVVIDATAGGAGFPALPEAAAEARAVAELYGDARVVDAFGRSAADLLASAGNASMLHYAGHTMAAYDAAARALRLGGPAASRVEMNDILAAPWSSLRLVFLSACETDTGPVKKSEGSLTVGRTFYAAGVPAVVGTLWPVDDGNARIVALSFHEHMGGGNTPAEALRQAQLTLLKRRGTDSIDWAAYRIIGGGF